MALHLRELAGRPVLRSELLEARGVPHAFGTRHGGASQGPYASNNMSVFNGDDPEAVLGNWAGLRRAAGLGEGASQHLLRQVHGADLVEVAPPSRALPFHHEGAADGLATRVAGVALGIITADCVPVFLYYEAHGEHPEEVAALHCGWRSTLAELLLRCLARRPEPPAVLCLGPHIRQRSFEVGPELRGDFEEAFRRAGGDPEAGVRAGEGDRLLVDLEALLVAQARRAGVPDEALETGAPCTYSEAGLFFSYRRDGPGRGLLGHVIGLPGGDTPAPVA